MVSMGLTGLTFPSSLVLIAREFRAANPEGLRYDDVLDDLVPCCIRTDISRVRSLIQRLDSQTSADHPHPWRKCLKAAADDLWLFTGDSMVVCVASTVAWVGKRMTCVPVAHTLFIGQDPEKCSMHGFQCAHWLECESTIRSVLPTQISIRGTVSLRLHDMLP